VTGGGIFYVNPSGYLLSINERSGAVVANVSLKAYPFGLAINQKSNMLYVSACQQVSFICAGTEILIINGSSHGVQSRVSLPFYALNLPVVAVDSDTDTVYTIGEEANLTLVAFDGASGALEYSTNLEGSCGGAGGGEIAMNAQANELYVAFDIQQLFLVINATTGHIQDMLVTSQGIEGLAFDSSTNQVYITTHEGNTGQGDFVILPGSAGGQHVDFSLLRSGVCLP